MSNERFKNPISESAPVRYGLIAAVLAFLALFVLTPLVIVFTEAFSKGIEEYLLALQEPDAVSAIRLTLLVAAIAVPLNIGFGIAAVMLAISFAALLAINLIQAWSRRRFGYA